MKPKLQAGEVSRRDRRAIPAFSWKQRTRVVLGDQAAAQLFFTEDPRGAVLFIGFYGGYPSAYLVPAYAKRGDYYEGTRVCPCDISDPREEEEEEEEE